MAHKKKAKGAAKEALKKMREGFDKRNPPKPKKKKKK